MINLRRTVSRGIGHVLGSILPRHSLTAVSERTMKRYPAVLFRTVAKNLNRQLTVENMPFDLPNPSHIDFEHLSGLFSSTVLDHGVISMPVRQAAYLFGLVRQLPATKIIEIGRYKGGSTLVLAAALGGRGKMWSIDIGEKVERVNSIASGKQNKYDDEIDTFLKKHGLSAELIIGDSRTLELDTGEVDLVFIDGDHTYEGVKIDFDRFGRRVRVGGAVLFDDVFDEAFVPTHSDTVGRLVREVVEQGEFKLVKGVNRLAHLERVRAAS